MEKAYEKRIQNLSARIEYLKEEMGRRGVAKDVADRLRFQIRNMESSVRSLQEQQAHSQRFSTAVAFNSGENLAI